MTTAARERPVVTGAAAAPGPLRPALRAALRLHRRTLWAVLAFVAVFGATVGGARAWSDFTADHQCDTGPGETCDGFLESLSSLNLQAAQGPTHIVVLLLWPALVAAFVAGPLIGRELESGLHRFGWTQSLTPLRWTAVRLVATAVVASAALLALSGLFRLADLPGPEGPGRWWSRGGFEGFGPVLLGHTLLAVGVGALAGLLLRRAFPAMAAAGSVSLLLLGVFHSARWQLWPTSTVTGPGSHVHGIPRNALPEGSHLERWGRVTDTGQHVPTSACVGTSPADPFCPPGTRLTGWYAEYHPRSVFWWAQVTETVLLLILAGFVLYAALRMVRRSAA